MKKILLSLALIIITCTLFGYPKQIGIVNDFAHVLTADESREIENEIRHDSLTYSKYNSNYPQIFVITVTSLEGENDSLYTQHLLLAWQQAKKDSEGINAAVLLLCPNTGDVRLLGFGNVMAKLTPVVSRQIIMDVMVPELRNGNLGLALSLGIKNTLYQINNFNRILYPLYAIAGIVLLYILFLKLTRAKAKQNPVKGKGGKKGRT